MPDNTVKSEANSEIEHGALVTPPHGRGKIRRGSKPGNTPGPGRPPNEFRDRMRSLTSRDDVEAYLERCINGEFGPKFFLDALRYTSDRGYGKPTQAVELTGAEGGPLDVTVTRRIVRPSADG